MFNCLNNVSNMYEFVDQAINCKGWSDLLYARKFSPYENLHAGCDRSLLISIRVNVDFDHVLKSRCDVARATLTRMIDIATLWLNSNNILNETLININIESNPGDKTCVG